ncbi:13680_t:CDS:2, partial [Cetraspora pellucida]
SELAKVIHKVDGILEHTNNLTIGLDGWTAPNGLLIWNFIIMTPLRQEYLYKLGNYSDQSHTAEFLASQIELIINRIAGAILKEKVIQHQISGGGLKTYIETRWTTIYECVSSIFNLSNPIEQLCHTQTAEITPEIMTNIAKTVFKEFEEEILIEDDDIEMLNPAENLYPNEQDLDLSISTSIDFKSSVFMSSNSYESENFNEIESDNNIQE